MQHNDEQSRYVFYTQGVCPPEIHFRLSRDNTVHQLRFVGGGCPGNALLVARLIEGKPIDALMECLSGIDCRNGTSCPDQLSRAFTAVKEGILHPATTFKVVDDAVPRQKIGFIGNLDGNPAVLTALIQAMVQEPVEVIYSVGNLTGFTNQNDTVLSMIRQKKIHVAAGQRDWQCAQGLDADAGVPLSHKSTETLLRFPQVLTFQVGDRKGMAFYGRYIQALPGYSDYEPFALEMNMVCDLTRFMLDESVFPALEAMTPQFSAQIIVFSEKGSWQSYEVGGVLFIGIGHTCENGRIHWGVLEHTTASIRFQVRSVPFNPEI